MPYLLFQLGKHVHTTQTCIKSHLEFKRNKNLVIVVRATLPTFYIFKVQGCEKTTFEIIDQEHPW